MKEPWRRRASIGGSCDGSSTTVPVALVVLIVGTAFAATITHFVAQTGFVK